MPSETSQRLTSDAVAALYHEHRAELYALVQGVLRNPDLAAEVLQNTFAKCLEHGHTAQASTLKGWLFRVAMNEALNIKRRQSVASRVFETIARQPAASRQPGAAEWDAVVRESAEQVAHALAQLPDEQRTVVHLRIYADLTFAEIARQLDLPLGTVISRMRLALQKLAAALHE